jgi:pyruvate,water dikinase
MAVVVQRMVAAEAAGVLFTRDPSDPSAGHMLVEGAWGLGEAVVSGRVTPDRWRLDRTSGAVLEAVVSFKLVMVVAGAEVPATRQGEPCLTAGQLQRLVQLARRIEAEYGAPQDVEWAVLGEEVWLLQSRSITATSAEREQVRREEIAFLQARAEPGGTVWARYSFAEVLPEPLPLSWGFWKQFMSGGGGYGRMYRELGYDPDPCLERDGVLDLIAGRPYFNLSREVKLYFHGFPNDYPFAKLKAHPERAIYPRAEANLAKAPRGFLFKLPGLTRRMLAAEKRLEHVAQELPEQLESAVFPRMAEYAAAMRQTDLARLTDRELLEAIERSRTAVFDEFAPQSLKSSVLAGLAIGRLQALLTPAQGEAQAKTTVDGLLVGAAPQPEWNVAAALRRLYQGTLSQSEFVAGFGHRGAGEMELAIPRWREQPPAVVAAPSGASGLEDAPDGPARLLAEAGKRLDRARFELQLTRARRFTALRESGKHFLMLGYEVLRLLLLELDGRYELHGGIFYLEPGELEALVGGTDLRGHIAARRRRRALALGLEAPRVVFSDDPEALGRPVAFTGAGEQLSGLGVSAGVAEGPALVLRHPEEAPAEGSGFILVCPSTDPGWVPLFLRARGVVLETGGILSHGAIVARELGLPAVVNVPDACARFRTGERIRVDGTAGRVWRL